MLYRLITQCLNEWKLLLRIKALSIKEWGRKKIESLIKTT